MLLQKIRTPGFVCLSGIFVIYAKVSGISENFPKF